MEPAGFQLWAAVSILVHLANGSPIMSLDMPLLEEDRPFFDEQDALLQTLQNELLKALNISDIPLQETAAKVDPPEYMLELFNRFATDKTSMPSANIIRSFKNEEQILQPIHFNGIRRYPLLFNVSIPHHEKITMAELRLYTLVQEDRMLYNGLSRKVTILEVLENDRGRGKEEEEERKMKVLASRHIYSTDNEWKTFEVTEAIRRWHHSDSTTHQLEVQIESRGGEEAVGGGKGDIDIDSETKHEPLLIVFSDDRSHAKKEEKHELNEIIEHEQDLQDLDMNGFHTSPRKEKLLQIRSNIIYDSTSRIRRNAKGSSCKKTSLYVDFKEIGWDSWIIAPPGYDASQCRGACSFPLDDHLTTTHAKARTLIHLNDPQKASPACCVPTKLDPISLLFLDNGVVTYKLNYEGMAVSECGCR
ncbi:bone morphogenetic protein 10 [Lacerta agilis]|uniref:bone morphogenetic protein 10 n=1 Tax=Lacerta agilis TaxID=80427 RepID=UPI001419B7A8|nr:bone morphogenetic protein 10 [Lacerta agilis]